MTIREIVELHPLPGSDFRQALLRCAEECLDCAASCTACADASLSESDLAELTAVIRVALDCADVCDATARIATRQSRPDIRLVRAMIEACAAACVACAEECDPARRPRRALPHLRRRLPPVQGRMRRSARLLTTATHLREMDESGRVTNYVVDVERRRRPAGRG